MIKFANSRIYDDGLRTQIIQYLTCLNEPFCQQIYSLCHCCIVFRKKLDDILWRASCLEISDERIRKEQIENSI